MFGGSSSGERTSTSTPTSRQSRSNRFGHRFFLPTQPERFFHRDQAGEGGDTRLNHLLSNLDFVQPVTHGLYPYFVCGTSGA